MTKPVLSIGFDVPFDEALKWGRDRVSVLPDTYYGTLAAQARSRAFTVSGLTSITQIQGVLESLTRAVKAGTTFSEWQETLTPQALALGKGHLDNVFRTAVQTHYNIGRYQQQAENKSHRPYIMYDAINDGRTRPHHRALDNFIADIDDVVWDKIYPPNGFRCRCSTISLTEAQARKRGWIGAPVLPAGGKADDGWDYHPAKSQDDMLSAIKSKKIAQLPPAIKPAAIKAVTPPVYWNSATDAGKWHDLSFASAPSYIKGAIKDIGDPLRVYATPTKTAHYKQSTRSIEMAGYKLHVLRDQGTWRHEFGHFIDGGITSRQSGDKWISASPTFRAAMAADSKLLIEKAAAGAPNAKITKARKLVLQEAYEKTRVELLDSADRDAWLERRAAAAGIDYQAMKSAMDRHTVFPQYYVGIGLKDRYRRMIVAYELQDAQGLMDAMTGGKLHSEAFATFDKGIVGKVSDLFGSATINKVCGQGKSGCGHSNRYYSQAEYLAGTECFANLVTMHADENEFFRQIVARFTPNMNAEFMSRMSKYAI
jgi:SPP1 gp7 family putative phage head morphogenesis protein